MKNKKNLVLFVLVWFTIIGVLALGYRYIVRPMFIGKKLEQTGSEGIYQNEINFYLDGFAGYSILRSPVFTNNMRDEGIKVNFKDDSADYEKRIKALDSGKADMAVFTVDSFLKSTIDLGKSPATIIAIIDESSGADAVFGYQNSVPNLQSLNNENARIIATANSPSEFIGRSIIAQFNLPRLPKDDWMIEKNGSKEVFESFKNASSNDPYVYIMWEPEVSKAKEIPNATLLLDSSNLKGFIVDVLVVNRDFLSENPDLVKVFLKEYLRSLFYYSQHRQELIDLIIQDTANIGEKITKKQAEDIVKGIQWKNTSENYAHLGLLRGRDARGLQNIEDILIKVGKILLNTGSIKSNPYQRSENSLYFDGVLKSIKVDKFHPGQTINIVSGVEGATMKLESVRESINLPTLTDQQWKELLPVGEMKIEPITFTRGSNKLSIKSKRDLANVVDSLRSLPYYYLRITGNSRNEGDIEANKKLALQRAEAVQDFILKSDKNIKAIRVKVATSIPSNSGGQAQSVTFELLQQPF